MTSIREAIHVVLPFHASIKVVTATPDYAVPTIDARNCLPSSFSKQDTIHNIQRVAVLTSAFIDPNPNVIYQAMKDRLHQDYRQHLIPGFKDILDKMNPDAYPGLLGVALSGAGPTILALALDNVDLIGQTIKDCLSCGGHDVRVRVLECDRLGARII